MARDGRSTAYRTASGSERTLSGPNRKTGTGFAILKCAFHFGIVPVPALPSVGTCKVVFAGAGQLLRQSGLSRVTEARPVRERSIVGMRFRLPGAAVRRDGLLLRAAAAVSPMYEGQEREVRRLLATMPQHDLDAVVRSFETLHAARADTEALHS